MVSSGVGLALRVLIVDDAEEDVRQVLAQLRQGGYDPADKRVETNAQFSQAVAEETWDLVVASHSLPDFSALECLETLRTRDLDLPVIVVSGTVAEEDLVAVMRAGARDCLIKSQLGRLCAAVERELREAEGRRARREAERRQREAEEMYRTLVEEIPAITYIAWADELGSPMYVSPQIKGMLGVSPAEWLADRESWARRLHPEDRERVLDEFRKAWASQEPFRSEYRIVHEDGRTLWWRDEGHVLPNSSGRTQFVRGLILDITDRKAAEEAVRFVTYHEPVSGLPNRAALHQQLEQALRDAPRGARTALLFLVMERFREIGNTLGHANAERLVRDFARRMGDVLGGAHRLARLRGDEFAVLLPGGSASLGLQVATKILRALEQPFMFEKLPIEVEVSIGISVAPDHGEDPEVLLRHADVAMQAARREAAGCVVYSRARDPHDPRSLGLLGELRRAIEAGDLELHYQPKVDLKTRSVVGAEALLRWRHAKHGLVTPDQFVPLAEQGGLIKPLTTWVLSEALRQCAAWRQKSDELPIAVNLSARNLQDPQLVQQVSRLLEARGLPPKALQLELTESAVMTDPVRAVETLAALAASGIGVSIDDFGTGYSSLAYLGTLPVSELKIDKSFVMGIAAHRKGDAAIVRSTNELGHNLGLSVVAEGVEDEKTLEMLGSMGCDAAQGYHIARPMPVPDFERWLGESPWRLGAGRPN
jgi:diguanylate cyclase (GGDEF)-like protein/PAS domain S-box-containing protein